MDDRLDAFHVLTSSFALSSVGGLAAILRSKAKLTWRSVFAATLYSGLTGVTIALIWYNKYQADGDLYFLMGVSALAGIGGVNVVDFVLQLWKNSGLNFKVIVDQKKSEDNKTEDFN